MEVSLYLDPQIRDWVLFPITLVMILVGILRHNVALLLQSAPKKLSRAATREQRALLRSQILRESVASSPVPPLYYNSISNYLNQAFEAGTYLKDGLPSSKDGKDAATPNPLDPNAMEGMMGGLKAQAVMMVPQMILMGWINFFFQGFVLIKLPFPLTLGFKSMLQRGIETPDMDVRWVSSLSWYFLNFFGLNGLYRLILGNDNAAIQADPVMNPYANAQLPSAMPGQPQDFSKLFKAERDNLALADGLYNWAGADVESRVLRKYGRIPS
ncbi:hypothetical protein ACEPAI_5908 [Sanghuangporus weigelae]